MNKIGRMFWDGLIPLVGVIILIAIAVQIATPIIGALNIPLWISWLYALMPESTTTWWVIPFILGGIVATYAWLKYDVGKGGVFFLYLFGTALFITLFAVMIFGPEGAIKAYGKLQEGANRTVENGISFTGESNTVHPTEARPVPVDVYDVLVPGRGCSEPAENTDSRFWINPSPKDARTGWPDKTLVLPTDTANHWVPYKSSMRSYSYIRWCNNTGRTMWMTVEVYKGRL